GDRFPLVDENHRISPGHLDPACDEDARRAYVCRLCPDPLEDTEGLKRADFETACQAEGALLLNPYFDDPDRYFAWEADRVLREVKVVPRDEASRPWCEAAEAGYGLNRKELCDERWNVY